MTFPRLALSVVGLSTLLLAACGGGDATTPAPATGGVAAAPLVVSAANPATRNGTLDKAATAAMWEGTYGDANGNYASGGANAHCRVAAYELPNSGDGLKYDVVVVFAKADLKVTRIELQRNGTPADLVSSVSGSGAVVDKAQRRIGFTGVVLSGTGGQAATLNGSLEYSKAVFSGTATETAACGG